jgi:exodeoxyribonuclease VIII
MNKIVSGMPFDQYTRAPGISKSSLVHLARSPGYLQYRLKNPQPTTEYMQFGSAVDCIITEGIDAFNAQYLVKPDDVDFRTKIGKKWREDNAEKIPVSATVLSCAESVKDHPLFADFVDCQMQQSIFWTDEEAGVNCKIRPDFTHQKNVYLADLKTTGNVSPEAFGRDALKWKYHWQAAMYLDGMSFVTGKDFYQFYFIVVERDPPHRVEVYETPLSVIELGREEYRSALQLYADCKKSGDWPLSTNQIQALEFPGYAWR